MPTSHLSSFAVISAAVQGEMLDLELMLIPWWCSVDASVGGMSIKVKTKSNLVGRVVGKGHSLHFDTLLVNSLGVASSFHFSYQT